MFKLHEHLMFNRKDFSERNSEKIEHCNTKLKFVAKKKKNCKNKPMKLMGFRRQSVARISK